MTTIDERFDAKVLRLRALLAEAKPRPWQWLDSGGEPGECDELQDGAGEMIATGFLDDIGLTTDGRLCAAAVNALPALLDVAEAARPIVDMRPAVDIVTGLREQAVILRAALDRLEGTS